MGNMATLWHLRNTKIMDIRKSVILGFQAFHLMPTINF